MKFRGLNKKADVRTLAPTELVGYILAAAVFILILLVAGIFTTLYFSEKNEEFAVNNFIALANSIETLSLGVEKFDVQRGFPFYLPSDFVVVGFNKEWDNNKVSDGCESEAVRKPDNRDGKEGKKCEDAACICLFGNNDDFMDGDKYNVELIQCRPLPEVDYITTLYLGTSQKDKDIGENYKYPPGIYKNIAGEKIDLPDYTGTGFSVNYDYAFFYLYGECDNYIFDKNLKSRKLYIEKFRDDKGKQYIFILPEYGEAGIAYERYEAMNGEYGRAEIS